MKIIETKLWTFKSRKKMNPLVNNDNLEIAILEYLIANRTLSLKHVENESGISRER